MLIECLFFLLSTVFLYAIGVNRAIVVSADTKGIILSYIKTLLTGTSTVSLSYLLVQILLVPYQLQELYPVICIIIFSIITVFFEVLIRLTARTSVSELSVSFLCILLALNESLSLVEAVLFVLCTLTSFYILIPFLYAVRKRNEAADALPVCRNSLILFSLAMMMFILLVLDVSWLGRGVMR